MGQARPKQLIILTICFFLTACFIYSQPEVTVVGKTQSLQQAFENINGWQYKGFIQIDENIERALELDDYINNRYSMAEKDIFLYIGYYFTAKKLGAVHSPLVCFPGQGWVVSDTGHKKDRIGDNEIDFMTMLVTRGKESIFILYWYQAYDKTSAGTLAQKTNSLLNKIVRQKEENAFVRISIPMGDMTEQEASRIGVEFIKAFYPNFLKYIDDNI